MAELLFKTNIKCNGCIATVTPFLNGEKQIEEWKVDLENPGRILSVKSEKLSAGSVIDLVKKAGYTAEEMK
ncbi:MAG: heavy-metal-associated domain-containing protein [Ignavibacteria bacterium]|nr:heavy-metal-associated domain-containing protein [Ignavibacteria bacterium]